MNSKRIEWIDVAKYIAMIFVVLLHFGVPWQIDEIVHVFHMPVFFLISGYCFDWSRHQKFKPFLLSRVRSLLIPYLSFSLLFYVFWSVAYLLIDPNEMVSVPVYLRSLLLTNTTAVQNLWGGVQWFLTSLFFVELLFWCCRKTGKYVSIILVLLFSCFGFVFAQYSSIRLPLAFDTALVMLLFYGIGYFIKEKEYLERLRKCHFLIHVGLLVISVLFTVLVWRANGSTNVRVLLFGNPFLYILGAVTGSLGVFFGAWLVERLFSGCDFWPKVLYVGRNTIIILYAHRLYIGLFNVFVFSHVTGLAGRWKYVAVMMLTIAFFALLAYPICKLVNEAFPILIGKRKRKD